MPPSGTAHRSKRPKKGVRSYNAGPEGHGRKRHIPVDTMGLLRAVTVHPADIPDQEDAPQVPSAEPELRGTARHPGNLDPAGLRYLML